MVLKLKPQRIRPGQFVYTPDKNRIGKVVELSGQVALVRLRHSAVRVEEKHYAVSELERAYLWPEMRVFYSRDETVLPRAGRIRYYDRDGDLMSYEVRFPNDEEIWLDEEDLETRTFLPYPDPTEALAEGYCETQFFYDRRMAVQQVLMHARQHSGGLTGLISASVDLLPHQVAVVRRVLSDPIQRYLLADEVGMGKTIEAGAILRQILLDDQKAKVVVGAPAPLVWQWERELREKFHFEEFDGRWQVVPFAELTNLAVNEIDTLVIDESHHLVAPKAGQEILAHDELAALAHTVPRLFLLTATPVLADPMATLRLLHLLDPQVHSLDDIDGFTHKLEKRQEYGRLLIQLMPGLNGFPLNRQIKALTTTFPDDPKVMSYVSQLNQPGITQEEIDDAVRAIKRYIMETYRIHQRLVRTRRGDLEWEMLSRADSVRTETDLNLDEMEMLASALEDWRDLAQRFGGESGPEVEAALARRYVQFFDALGEGVESLARTVEWQETEVKSGLLTTFPEDLTYLARLQDRLGEVSEPDSKRHALVDVIQRYKKNTPRPITGALKCVLFTTSTEEATAVSLHLTQKLGKDAIVTVLTGDDPRTVEQAVRRFEQGRTLMVLVSDRAGEEGLNLQGADALIHLDLPLDPARLEQRIGRVDRFGRKKAGVPQTVLLPTDEEGSPWDAWRELLDESFQLFSESVSDVQFRLEAIQFELSLHLFRVGADGLLRAKEWVTTELDQERTRLWELHQMDTLIVTEDRIDLKFDTLDAGDSAERYEDLDRWMKETLHFDWHSAGPEAFKYRWRSPQERPATLMSRWPWAEELEPLLAWPYTFSREAARANLGTRLLRPGARLVSTLQTVMIYEDRGTSFATWRYQSQWPADRDEWLGFRLSYVVEFDLEAALGAMSVKPDRSVLEAVRRRADALFAPRLETVTLDIDLNPETDPEVLRILEAPYVAADRKGSDFNLSSRRTDLFELINPKRFRDLCGQVSRESSRLIRKSPSYLERVAEGVRKARMELGTKVEMLLYRQQQNAWPDPAIEFEVAVNKALMETVASPHVRLDAIGCFVISNRELKRRVR